jgi:Family of unknown function (DUF5996)
VDDERWPELPYEAWRDTKQTLHLYLQIIGKLRRQLAPPKPHYGHLPLYVTARGVMTSPLPHSNGVFDIDVDFVDHAVSVRTVEGHTEQVPLEPRAVADFHAELEAALERANRAVELPAEPSELTDPVPFREDHVHSAYDATAANRFWLILVEVDAVLKEHRAGYAGKTTPAQLFWGSLDITYSRFAGADDAQEFAAGFWPGDETTRYPAFYAYTVPKPDGIESAAVEPEAAHWSAELGEHLLPYDDVRTAADRHAALWSFLESTSVAGGIRS